MIQLQNAVKAWGRDNFKDVVKAELEKIDPTALPLQQGLAQSSFATNDAVNVMVLNVSDEADVISVRAGIFYKGLIPGCSCEDDPTPSSEYQEYCEMQFDIDKKIGFHMKALKFALSFK